MDLIIQKMLFSFWIDKAIVGRQDAPGDGPSDVREQAWVDSESYTALYCFVLCFIILDNKSSAHENKHYNVNEWSMFISYIFVGKVDVAIQEPNTRALDGNEANITSQYYNIKWSSV